MASRKVSGADLKSMKPRRLSIIPFGAPLCALEGSSSSFWCGEFSKWSNCSNCSKCSRMGDGVEEGDRGWRRLLCRRSTIEWRGEELASSGGEEGKVSSRVWLVWSVEWSVEWSAVV